MSENSGAQSLQAPRARVIPPLNRDNTLAPSPGPRPALILPTILEDETRQPPVPQSIGTEPLLTKQSNNQRKPFLDLTFESPELEAGFLKWHSANNVQRLYSSVGLWTILIIIVSITLFCGWYQEFVVSASLACVVGVLSILFWVSLCVHGQEKVSKISDLKYEGILMSFILVLSLLVLVAIHFGEDDSNLGNISIFYVVFILSGVHFRLRFVYQLIVILLQVGGYVLLAWVDEGSAGTLSAVGILAIGFFALKMSRDLELHVREEYQQGTDMQAVTRGTIFSMNSNDEKSLFSVMTPLESAVMSLKRLHDAPGMPTIHRDTIKNVMGILYHLYDLDESPVPLSSVPIDQTTEAWLKQEMMLTGFTSIKKQQQQQIQQQQPPQFKLRTTSLTKTESDNATSGPIMAKPALKRGSSELGTLTRTGSSMPKLNDSDDEDDIKKSKKDDKNKPKHATSGSSNSTDISGKTWNMMKTGQRLSRVMGENAVYPEQSLPKDVMNRVENLLQKIDGWNFPVIELDEITKGNSLYFVALAIFQRRGFIEKFQLSPRRLRNFLLVVQSNYRPNPYHNSTHAADVTQTNHALLYEALDSEDYSFVIFCSVFACIIHDYEHTGVNNDFLVRSRDPRALVFNDRSCQENHHLAAAFACLSEDENNFVHAMSPERKKDMRKIVIDLVLATDMSQHNAILSSFRLKLSSGALKLEDEDSLLMILKMGIKCADISHTSKEDFLHAPWTERITNEFLNQGDLERELGLTVSPFMDRRNLLLAKSQLGFFQFIVEPLFEAWAKYLEVEEAPFLFHIKQNKEKYKAMRIIEEQKVAEATSAGQTDKK